MFNGIVYNQGLIKSFKKSPRYVRGSLVVEIASNISFKKTDIGESVCCDGVCLTLMLLMIKDVIRQHCTLGTQKKKRSGRTSRQWRPPRVDEPRGLVRVSCHPSRRLYDNRPARAK